MIIKEILQFLMFSKNHSTRDSDFLKSYLRIIAKYGIIYIGEPIRKDVIEKLARNIVKALEIIKEKASLIIIASSTIELYPLAP